MFQLPKIFEVVLRDETTRKRGIMEIRLKVIGGKNDGKEIPIQVAEFLIGRGEEANLRPASDLVSRKHCTISSKQGKALLIDHGSRNGTFLNGEAVKGENELKPGDRLRVGRLVFEVLIDVGQPGIKKPRVDGVADAASRAAGNDAGGEWNDDSISSWLTGNDEAVANPEETRQFNLEDSNLKLDDTLKGDSQTTISLTKEEMESAEKAEADRKAKEKKKGPGKLPEQARKTTDNSKDAATDVLQKFFNRR